MSNQPKWFHFVFITYVTLKVREAWKKASDRYHDIEKPSEDMKAKHEEKRKIYDSLLKVFEEREKQQQANAPKKKKKGGKR